MATVPAVDVLETVLESFQADLMTAVPRAISGLVFLTVAGVYLLRDPDFNTGDTVTTESMTGTVTDIGLRKRRLRTEEGLAVLANRTDEARWTHRSGPDEEG